MKISRFATVAVLLTGTTTLAGATTGEGAAGAGTSAPARHGPARAAAAQPLTGGFVLRDTATGQGRGNLTDFGYLPGGGVLTTGKDGLVTWVHRGGRPREIRHFATDTRGDLGLVGIGIAPDYHRTHHVYLIRSLPAPSAPPYRIRLSRFTVRGGSRPTGLGREKVLLEVSAPEHTHAMTTVLPARDGTLWVSVGDLIGFDSVRKGALRALRLGGPAGKILHVTASGAGVRANPYYQRAHPSSWRSRTWARGFRSPFRLSLDPASGRPVVADVGWRHWEEVDLVRRGGNYKWPCWEGPARTPGYSDMAACAGVRNTRPMWSYRHDPVTGAGSAVTGGVVYTGRRYPHRYRGAYFFGDFAASELWSMRFSAAGRVVRRPEDPPLGTGIGEPVRFGRAPNGDVVIADLASGHLRRLTR